MGFWNNVVDELEYQGKTRKWLAAEANLDVSTIGAGLKRDGYPQADIALRIAKALNVPMEQLLTGVFSKSDCNQDMDVHLYHKYLNTLKNLEKLEECTRNPILNMIEQIANR